MTTNQLLEIFCFHLRKHDIWFTTHDHCKDENFENCINISILKHTRSSYYILKKPHFNSRLYSKNIWRFLWKLYHTKYVVIYQISTYNYERLLNCTSRTRSVYSNDVYNHPQWNGFYYYIFSNRRIIKPEIIITIILLFDCLLYYKVFSSTPKLHFILLTAVGYLANFILLFPACRTVVVVIVFQPNSFKTAWKFNRTNDNTVYRYVYQGRGSLFLKIVIFVGMYLNIY